MAETTCSNCGTPTSKPGEPCEKCGTRDVTIHVASVVAVASAANVTVHTEKLEYSVEIPSGATREERLERRLHALISAGKAIILHDDDPDCTLVGTPAIKRLLGFLATNERDLGPKTGPGQGDRI